MDTTPDGGILFPHDGQGELWTGLGSGMAGREVEKPAADDQNRPSLTLFQSVPQRFPEKTSDGSPCRATLLTDEREKLLKTGVF
jgi:hypothetical protein